MYIHNLIYIYKIVYIALIRLQAKKGIQVAPAILLIFY